MVGQYFKRRREFVEIFLVSGSGIGLSFMALILKGVMKKIDLPILCKCSFAGLFYRSASLYHPQRRAILHLKSQKRKIKEKKKSHFLTRLKSITIRIVAVSAGVSSIGMNTPIIYLVINHTCILSHTNHLLLTGYPGTEGRPNKSGYSPPAGIPWPCLGNRLCFLWFLVHPEVR